MTAQSAIPLKWYVPFANGDSARVELPVTTADPTRASQTLGFPPLTMQPPESGGVPPQGEDFNGGMNQVARIAWWALNGGGWPFDATFAANSNINGYPNGAKLQSADFRGDWISAADNNQNNPDTNGTNWVPGFQYGVTNLTGLTGGTVTPTPAQAAKNSITLAGTLTSALTVVLPIWTKNWTITNNTTGAFVVIVKTAAGSGVTIPQNGRPTRVSGDGTNIVQAASNIAQGTSPTNALTVAQGAGVAGSVRNLTMQVAAASATATLTADEIIVETALGGTRYCLANFNQTVNLATTGAGGMDVGSAPASGYVALYAIWNPATATAALLATNATSAAAPSVWTGGTLPAGYTASGLLVVHRTNASSQFVAGAWKNRNFWYDTPVSISGAVAVVASYTQVDISSFVPANAIMYSSNFTYAITSAANANLVFRIAGNANGLGDKANAVNNNWGATQGISGYFTDSPIITPQKTWYQMNGAPGSGTWFVSGYSI